MINPLLDHLLLQLDKAQHPLIFGHVKPDGDAFGSALGLMWLLRRAGKQAEVSFWDSPLLALDFLPGMEEVTNRPLQNHDLIIAVDGSDRDRYGETFTKALQSGVPTLCIDHHKTNTLFADDNWVDSHFAATAQMIYHLARYAGWEITPDVATCLATGCVTDTGAFSTDHTTPDVLETVASLMRHGAPLSQIIRQAFSSRTSTEVHLWGKVLSTLQIERGVAWALNRQAERDVIGAKDGDGGGLSGFLRDIVGVYVSIVFTEVDQETVRLSMRSRPGYDVGQLAYSLGGGGHAQAAGATLHMSLEDAVDLVITQAIFLTSSGNIKL